MTDSTETVITGAQEPTSWHCPAFESSYGDEAIKFLEDILGFRLFPWQKFLLRQMLGENQVSPGVWKWAARQVVVSIPRQNGKSFLLDCLILVGLFVLGERIVLTAQNRDTAARSFLRIVALLEEPKFGFLRKQVKRISKRSGNEFIETRNGGVFFVKTRGPDSARGLDAIDRLLQDEAYDLDEGDLQAIMPTVLASPNPQVCYFSTPPRNALIGEPFARLRQRGENKEPGVACFIWGIDPKKLGDDFDPSDRKLWVVNPSLELPGGMPIENLEIMHGSLSPAAFAIECLGVWPEKLSNSLITPDDWSAIADTESVMPSPVAFAVDITPQRTHACIAAYGVREDGIGHVELVEYREGTEWLTERLRGLKERHNPVAIAVDIAGPAGTLILDLAKAEITEPANSDEPEYGDLLILRSGRDIGAACGQFVDAVKQKRFVHPSDPTLNVAVGNAISRPIGDAFGWDRKKPTVDISPLVASTLARYAYESRAHLVNREYDVMNSVWFGGGD